MSVAVPKTPLTVSGGVAMSYRFQPQQTTLPVPAWIAQVWKLARRDVGRGPRETPLTASGGIAWP